MDQETTDTQKPIIQHIYKLLERPEDWTIIDKRTSEFERMQHLSGFTVGWITLVGATPLVFLRTPGLTEDIPLGDESLRSAASNLRRRLLDSSALAFLESIPQ
jgi:rhodanese-related sulfurtransferase